MLREEAIKMLERIKHIGNGESEYKNDAQAIAIDMAIKALEQEPNKEAYNKGFEDGYLAGQKNIAERFEDLIKSGISTDTPDDIEYVIGLLNELSSANPEDPETEIEELDFVQEHKKIPVTLQVQKYCDRNICVSNEYNGIGCDECEVTKSQEPKTDYIAHGTDGNIYKLTISNGKEFEQEPCDDAVSRADVRHLIAEVKRKSLYSISSKAFEKLYNGIDDLPPVKQEPKTEQFAKWVATEIFDDMWEYNKDSFAEIACRKLAKLGIVRAKGDEWELVEPQKSEDKE